MKYCQLKSGDKVVVIAPSTASSLIDEKVREIAIKRLEALGLQVELDLTCEEAEFYGTANIAVRIEQIHKAFARTDIQGIFTFIGGFHSNQLLPFLDFELIAKNPKFFSGYSDITALNNALLAKAKLVTLNGPHFSSFGEQQGFEYTMQHFKNLAFKGSDQVLAPLQWSDDLWFLDQDKREFLPHQGHIVLNPAKVSGTVLGGNISTFRLLQGTPFMPEVEGEIILFLEEAGGEENSNTFIRTLVSISQQDFFKQVTGLVIGKFQKVSKRDLQALQSFLESHPSFKDLTIILEANCSHVTPRFSIPIGGQCTIEGDKISFQCA